MVPRGGVVIGPQGRSTSPFGALAGASPCRFRFHKAALPMNVPIRY